jgi:hypothetical protein
MDCMDPPIQIMPAGKWHCPICPPLPPEEQLMDAPPNISDAQQLDMPNREPSVASSSRLSVQLDGVAYKGKGKATVVVVSSDDSDSEEDMDVDVVSTTPMTRPRPRKSGKSKSRSMRMVAMPSDGLLESPGLSRHARTRVTSSPTLPKVRLRLPAQKGKRRDREEEEAPKGMFDDILTQDDRDISKTSIRESDKQLFERSRVLAEVSFKSILPTQPSLK